jgi:hypothetical protein
MSFKKELNGKKAKMRWRDLLARLWLNDEEPLTQVDEYDCEQLRRWHRERLDRWANLWP